MKKKGMINLIVAILWIGVACYFFSVDRTGVGMAWLLIGIINVYRFLQIRRLEKEEQAIKQRLDEISVSEDVEEAEGEEEKEVYMRQKTLFEVIEPANEVHTIYDEYIGYGYEVDKVFKPAKSHAGEVELLCTYAPDEEYGAEGTFPYIAVQDCDEVYCAIEEYRETGTFEGAISIETIEGNFLFRAKREYYGDIMYFYGFELDEEEYWQKAGLCLVYDKEYVGTKAEETLLHILDEAAKSFKKEKKTM